jgi:hypothetical protein
MCQKCKITAVKKYGNFSLPSHMTLDPWEDVHVDLIGTWDTHYNSTSVPGKGTTEKIQVLSVMTKPLDGQSLLQPRINSAIILPSFSTVNGNVDTQGLPE